jgi:hypothetical protein
MECSSHRVNGEFPGNPTGLTTNLTADIPDILHAVWSLEKLAGGV